MRPVTIALAAASALLLAGCATAAPRETAAPAASSAAPSTATPTAEETPEPVADPTCETLIPAQTVADFEDLGWGFQEEPFMIVATEIDGGLVCKWGGSTGTGEGLQIFGWAPIGETASRQAQADLLANGWQTIESTEGTFITENPETAFAVGAEGYGLTYQFGDGWVIYADTKQSLVLIQRPQT